MTILLAIASFVGSLLCACAATSVLAYKRAYLAGLAKGDAEGYERGYELGRAAADNWWFGAESQIDQTRVEIWREEEA